MVAQSTMNFICVFLCLFSLLGFGRAQRGKYHSPQECIARAPDPHKCDIHSTRVEHGSSTLHAAVFRGDASLVARILKKNNVNPNDSHHVAGTNLLIAACEKERFRKLFSKIARTHIRYGSKWSAWDKDIDPNIQSHLRQLDKLSADKSKQQLQKAQEIQKGQMVSVIKQVANHHSEAALRVPKMLLEAKMDANGVDQLGRTALFEAVESFSLPLVTLLLKHGANATHVDLEGTTPMMLAQRYNLRAIIALLASNGAAAPTGDLMTPTKSQNVLLNGLNLDNIAKRMEGNCDFDILDAPKWNDFKNQYIRGIQKPALIRHGFQDRPKPQKRKVKRRRGRKKRKTRKKNKEMQGNDSNKKWTVPKPWTKRKLSTFRLSSVPVEVGTIPYATLTAQGYFQTEMPLKEFLHRHLHPDNQKSIPEHEQADSGEKLSAEVNGGGHVATTDSADAIKSYFICVNKGGASYHSSPYAGYGKRGEKVKKDDCVSGKLTSDGDWIIVSSDNPAHHGTYLPLRTSAGGEVFRPISKREAQLSYVFDPKILRMPAAAPLIDSLHSRRPYVSDPELGHAVTNTQLAIGPKGSGAPRHIHDGAFSVLVSGKKLWAIWPPGDAHYSNVRTADDWRRLFQAPPEGQGRPFLCVQQKGETVFVPAFWAHSTMVVSDVGYAVGDSFSGSTMGYMSRR